MSAKQTKRPYRKKKRALQEKETRRRITEAAVRLHGTVGPAGSGVTDIAKLAGVSRMTVYNHFPTEADLFAACSSHWAAQNPFPEPSAWSGIEEPGERLETALRELYQWYGRTEGMLENVLRDAATVPAVASALDGIWWPYLREVVDTLACGWAGDRADESELTAAVRLAVDFATWRLLTASGLSDRGAAKLVARMLVDGVIGG